MNITRRRIRLTLAVVAILLMIWSDYLPATRFVEMAGVIMFMFSLIIRDEYQPANPTRLLGQSDGTLGEIEDTKSVRAGFLVYIRENGLMHVVYEWLALRGYVPGEGIKPRDEVAIHVSANARFEDKVCPDCSSALFTFEESQMEGVWLRRCSACGLVEMEDGWVDPEDAPVQTEWSGRPRP